ncbi:MAG: hypothetical protein AAGE59_37445, partial [Cyanobacteria bacterium P01_F01_bin.86]
GIWEGRKGEGEALDEGILAQVRRFWLQGFAYRGFGRGEGEALDEEILAQVRRFWLQCLARTGIRRGRFLGGVG